jgi:hypothetical protein
MAEMRLRNFWSLPTKGSTGERCLALSQGILPQTR